MYERLTDEQLKFLEEGPLACQIAVVVMRNLRHALRNLVDQIEHEDGAIECGYAHEVLGDDDE